MIKQYSDMTWWYRLKAKLKYGVIWNIQTAFSFWKIGLKALRGQLLIIDTRVENAKGGYKYFVIIVSKTPLSEKHTYEDL